MRLLRFALVALLVSLSSCCYALQSASAVPATASTQRQTAIALEKTGDLQKAEQEWRRILKANSRSAEAYAHLGLLAARANHYEQAIPLYRKALSLNPAIPGLRMDLGLALFKGEHPTLAISEFTQLLNAPDVSATDAYRLRVLIGMAHYGQGEYADAIPYLKEAATADPRNLELRLILAHSCMWTKQKECVLDTYKEILTIDPESAEAYILAGEALDEMKNTAGAIEQFRKAIKANPRQPHVHFGLGYLLWTQEAYDEASREFQAELSLDPTHTQSLLYLADIAVKSNRFGEARPMLESVEKADPSLSLAHLDMGIILADAGKTDDALKELKEASRLDPADVDAHWRLGRIYRSSGNLQDARREFDKAKELNQAVDHALFQKIANGRDRDETLKMQAAPSGK
jgi:tetratricopeptide (TPR) repeat protein